MSLSTSESVTTTNITNDYGYIMPWPESKHDWTLDWLYIVLVVAITEPYIELREYDQAACTGTLLSPHLVLTTATCLGFNTHTEVNPRIVRVHERPGNVLKALKIYLHPNYRRKDSVDLAIIVTEPSNQTVFPKLPKTKYDFEKGIENCIMGGYGDLNQLDLDNFSWASLREPEISANVISCKEGQQNHLCVHFNDLTPCPGDVGSPVVCDNTLQAIYTPRQYFKRCVYQFSTAFTAIYYELDFVERVMVMPTMAQFEWLSQPIYILLLCAVILAIIGGVYKAILRWLERTVHLLDDEPEAPPEPEVKEIISDTSCVTMISLPPPPPPLLRHTYFFKSPSEQDEKSPLRSRMSSKS